MAKFVPVVIAEPADETSRRSFVSTLDAVTKPGLYHEAIVVVPGSLLADARLALGARAGHATFVTVPDGSGHAIMAAAGCVLADKDCPEAPILLMDASLDRSAFPDFHREVVRCAHALDEGFIVSFTAGDGDDAEPTGDYAFSFATARQEYLAHAPGIMAYAESSIARAASDMNVVRLDDAPVFFDPGSFGEVVASVSEAARSLRHRVGALREAYSPWTRQHGSYDGFYASRNAPTP